MLGAQPVRPIDLAAFYAAIANEGAAADALCDRIDRARGRTVYRHSPALTQIGSADRVSFYQLKTMLQGVLQRGTAHAIASMAPYVAGKTGTTDGENDAWFVGFTNDVTVAVWVGYDNADGKRRTLGSGQTGATVAIPIFEPIMQAVWAYHAPKAALAPPSPEARRNLVTRKLDLEAGDDPASPPQEPGRILPPRRERPGRRYPVRFGVARRGLFRSRAEHRMTAGRSSHGRPGAAGGILSRSRDSSSSGWGGLLWLAAAAAATAGASDYDPRSPQRAPIRSVPPATESPQRCICVRCSACWWASLCCPPKGMPKATLKPVLRSSRFRRRLRSPPCRWPS